MTALLALTALTASAHPYLSPGWIHHVKQPVNTTLIACVEKGICATLDLPTEEWYKAGYAAVYDKFVPDDQALQINDKGLIGTILIKNHFGADLPWVFKVSSEKWSGAVSKRTYFLD